MKAVKQSVFKKQMLFLVLTCVFISGCIQKKEKVYRVGVLSGHEFFADITDGFKQKMTELGYVEGKNIVYDIKKVLAPIGNENVLKKFVEDKVDLIFVFPTEATIEAKKVTKGTGVPVVFGTAMIEIPDVIESLRHPGENITGVQYGANIMAIKRLEILHEIYPQGKRIWIPYFKGYPTAVPNLESLKPVAKSLGITIISLPVTSADEIKSYLESREKSGKIGFDAILEIVEPVAVMPDCLKIINEFADKHKLPIAGAVMTGKDYGPILTFIPDNIDMGRLAALQADKIFNGAQSGALPVITPEGKLHINYKAAKRLGLNINEGLLSMAVEIIR